MGWEKFVQLPKKLRSAPENIWLFRGQCNLRQALVRSDNRRKRILDGLELLYQCQLRFERPVLSQLRLYAYKALLQQIGPGSEIQVVAQIAEIGVIGYPVIVKAAVEAVSQVWLCQNDVRQRLFAVSRSRGNMSANNVPFDLLPR